MSIVPYAASCVLESLVQGKFVTGTHEIGTMSRIRRMRDQEDLDPEYTRLSYIVSQVEPLDIHQKSTSPLAWTVFFSRQE